MIVTGSPPMSLRRVEIIRRTSRWATTLALLALTPKCVVCVAGYVGLGTALGLSGAELCGATINPTSAGATALVGSALALGSIGWLVRIGWRRCVRTPRVRRAFLHLVG